MSWTKFGMNNIANVQNCNISKEAENKLLIVIALLVCYIVSCINVDLITVIMVLRLRQCYQTMTVVVV